MTKLIAGRQIPVCSDAAKQLDEAAALIRKAQQKLQAAALYTEAERLRSMASLVTTESAHLEGLARNSFCAARRGEELPG